MVSGRWKYTKGRRCRCIIRSGSFAGKLAASGTSGSSSAAPSLPWDGKAASSRNARGTHRAPIDEGTGLSADVSKHVVHEGVEHGHPLGGDTHLLVLGADQLEDEPGEGPVDALATAGALGLRLATRLGRLLALASHVDRNEKEVGVGDRKLGTRKTEGLLELRFWLIELRTFCVKLI